MRTVHGTIRLLRYRPGLFLTTIFFRGLEIPNKNRKNFRKVPRRLFLGKLCVCGGGTTSSLNFMKLKYL